MEKEVVINPSKTYTKTEYSRAFGVTRPMIDKMIKDKKLDFVIVKTFELVSQLFLFIFKYKLNNIKSF